ncbi:MULTISPECIES: shikimate kinase [unclassified Variovorax]|uniref:shikimate kinase n=1 Tax=unclassified Variovorax TaxID=663243 RepID=UPI0013A5B43B|nr:MULTISPECIES: shikimate kinase [unclassified Variovorax]
MAVALVGLPGAGKSAVGRRLGQRLRLPFVDSDHLIEDRIGCSIRDYFEREGEASFRELEASVIADLAANAASQGVVATGGGAVLRESNRTLLRRHFHVVYLRSSPEDLFRRLRHDVKRPLLQVADPLGRLRDLYSARDPLYRETAHEIVETGRPSVAMLVNIIVMQLELAGIASPESDVDPPL